MGALFDDPFQQLRSEVFDAVVESDGCPTDPLARTGASFSELTTSGAGTHVHTPLTSSSISWKHRLGRRKRDGIRVVPTGGDILTFDSRGSVPEFDIVFRTGNVTDSPGRRGTRVTGLDVSSTMSDDARGNGAIVGVEASVQVALYFPALLQKLTPDSARYVIDWVNVARGTVERWGSTSSCWTIRLSEPSCERWVSFL